ncbi:MAG TPA: HupE/UreJ family protein [Chthoniobacterales bacterium]|nr:HupE/UreJ family protein [Chthoniobacterales bacterium]
MKRWFAIFLLVFALRANAHEVRPAYLELTERAAGEFDVLWKVPALGGTALAGEEIPHEQPAVAATDPDAPKTMPCGCPVPTTAQLSRGVTPIHPSMPNDAVIVAPPRVERIFGAEIKRWTIRVPHGLDGWNVTVHGLPSTMVDVLVRIAMADGRVVSQVLRPDAPSFAFTAETAGPAAGGYFRLGVEHILFGIDHLLFVLALVLIVRGVGLLVKTITAFTVAHSITLGLATLGYVHVPSAPVEAAIALSIVFVASEILRRRRGERGLTERAPWLVAGTFGLLHGFGFAGALSEVGLPGNDIPLALLFFNLGVEAGQLAFVVVALGVIESLRRIRLPEWAPILPPYAIGSMAMFWVIERTVAIW